MESENSWLQLVFAPEV